MENLGLFGVILGVLIVFNFIISIAKHNLAAFLGWFVAGLEWLRRLI